MKTPENQNLKVKYFSVGVGKCGTSWLFELIQRHQLLSTPSIKEPYLMDCDEKKRDREVASLYESKHNMCDFSTLYYWDVDNAQKIYDYNPEAKIIITMRRPSDRIASHFQFLKRCGEYTGLSLAQYLERGDPVQVVRRSDYHEMIARYRNTFGEENVLLLPTEQLKSDPQKYVDRFTTFCGLPRHKLTEEDKKPVLERSTARSPLMAKSARQIGAVLRQVRFLKLLSFFKNSPLVKRFLFSSNATVEKDKDFGSQASAIAEMDHAYAPLLESCNG